MKKLNVFPTLLLSFLIFISCKSYSGIRLPSIFSDNMVLQQRADVQLWGWSAPGEKIYITASWNNITDSVTANGNAHWKKTIQTPAAGGPYTLTFKGSNTIVLNNVMLGEVWVCSGQSNMQWSYNNNLPEMEPELKEAAAKTNIRFFQIPQTTSNYPQDNCPGTWKTCGPETLKSFSAVAYFFGKELEQQLHVPIGLINTSWGGTPAEVWTPEEAVENDPILKEAAAKMTKTDWWPTTPGATYNAMIAPLTQFNIAGAIWYQGESNTSTASTYQRLMTTMIENWRKAWNKDFPFYYVQIAPFNYKNKNIGALLREAQTKTMSVPNTGMVVITDLVDDIKDIHPRKKHEVSKRLAGWALAETYHKEGLVYKSPMYRNMEVNKNKATIYFDNAAGGLILKGPEKKATEFYIAGDDKNFLPADVKIEGDHLVLSSKLVKNPVAVRFSYGNTAIGNIFNREGLPVCPFRTDDWEVDTTKEK